MNKSDKLPMIQKKLKIGFIRTVMLFGFIIAIFLLFILFLTIPPGERLLVRVLESHLSNMLNHTVKIEKVETNLLSRFQIYGLTINIYENGHELPFLNLPYAQVRYKLPPLFHHFFSIQSIATDSLSVYMKQDSAGQWHVPWSSTKGNSDQSSAFHVTLNRLLVKNSTIHFQNTSVPISGSLLGLDLMIRSDEHQYYHAQINTKTLSFLYQDIPLNGEDLIVQALLKDELVQLDSLSLRISELVLTGKGTFKKPSISCQFKLSGNSGSILNPFFLKYASEFYPVDGNINLNLFIDGTISEPEGRIELTTGALKSGSHELGKSEIAVSVYPNYLEVEKCILHLLEGSIQGSGIVQLDSLHKYRLDLQLSSIDLNQLWQNLYHQESPFRGQIEAHLHASGDGIHLIGQNVNADLVISELVYRSKLVPDIFGRLNFKDGNGSFNLTQDQSNLSCRVQVIDQSLDGYLTADIEKLSPFSGLFGILDLSGALNMQGRLRGTLQSPVIEATMAAQGVTYQNFPVDSLHGQLSIEKDLIRLDRLFITGHCGSIDSLKSPFFLSELRGGFKYKLIAHGSIDSLFADFQMDLIDPGYGPVQFDKGSIQCKMNNNRIQLIDCCFIHDSVTFLTKGEYSIPQLTGEIDLQCIQSLEKKGSQQKVGCGKISLIFDLSQKDFFKILCFGSQIELGGILSIVPQHRHIDGEVQFHWTFQGNRFFPDSDFQFTIYRPSYEKVILDSLRGNVQLRENLLSIERLSFYLGQHESWIESHIDLDRREDSTLFISNQSQFWGKAQGSEFQFEALNPFIPPRIKCDGIGHYNLSWRGNLKTPRITGQMAIKEGSFQYGMNNEPIQKIEFSGSFEDTVFHIHSFKGMVKQIPFNLNAFLIAHQNQDIELEWNLAVSNQENILSGKGLVTQDSIRFQSSIDRLNLNLLQPYISSIERLEGTCTSQLKICGLRNDPQIDGSIRIDHLSCNLPFITSKFHQGHVALRFKNDRITIDSLGCFINEGFCLLNGYADHDMGVLIGADFNLKMEQLIFQRSKELILRIDNGDLHYTGQNGSYLLEGDLILGESRFFTGFKPQNITTFFRSVEKPKIEYHEILKQTRVRVMIRNSEKVWIDNNLARLRLHPEVTMIGTLVQPNLTGRITAREGYLLYLDRKFRVVHGWLDFIDPNKVNPIVDLEAQTSLKTYQTLEGVPYSITLRVTGPIQEAKTDLVSEPSLDKLDIITLLTLGATRQRLSGRDSEQQSISFGEILKDRLAGISSDRISGYTTQKVGNLLGLENMTIEGNLFKFGKSWGPQLVASKKITNRMEVSYTTTVGHSNDQSIRLNYYLNKKISLQGQTDQRGRSAIDLKYGLRFK